MSKKSAIKVKQFIQKEADWVHMVHIFLALADAKKNITKGIEKVPSDSDTEVKDPVNVKLKQLNKTDTVNLWWWSVLLR